ncbi:C1QL [Mytilus coruscus]|uniref:C1QL n=1 Tax=Mytilus coruscus TaxID=42192 RepID=A0A6J8DIE3_MYTCO|nr:C1QL [Mytilus coruscus]
MTYVVISFIFAVVEAQMTLDISKNEKRIGEISAEQKKDQSVVAQRTLDISKNAKRIEEISAEQKKDQSVVAQRTLDISKNAKRIGEISAEQKKDQSEIKPAFTAYFKNGGLISLARGQILIFDTVQFNVGGGYNPGTGYFTVPRAGLYLVSCKVRSHSNKHLHVWLVKNHNKVALTYGENGNEGSFSLPVQVAKGDHLVITHETGSHANDEYVQGDIVSFFSAVFIFD